MFLDIVNMRNSFLCHLAQKTMEAIVIVFDVSTAFSVSSVYIKPSKKSLKMPKW